ncbi:MAG TPA: mechanosensitive ion channel domain-containing protein [Saprospiraceae bacterium]|nr:mechanosensitive ion channel domain-containing protein [Saprospiraceae bacterium]
MMNFIRNGYTRFNRNPLSYSFKITLLILALLDQYKWNLNIHNPFDHYLSTLSKYVIFFFIVEVVQRLIIYLYKIGRKIKKRDNIIVGVNQIASIVKIFGLIFWSLMLLDVNIKELFTSLSIIAAAIAILAKDYISNVISGMTLTWSNQISINDYVKIDEYTGKIIDISLINIHLLSEDDDLIYIPNNIAFNTKIVNYTKIEVKKTSIAFELDTRNVSSVEDLEQKLINSLDEYKSHIKPASYNLKVVELQKNAISFKFQYILTELDKDLEREIRKKTIRRILTILNSNKLNANIQELDANNSDYY